MIKVASSSSKKAYAPYSKFGVGAAVLLESGEICLGSNQENGAFPSGLCAERVAIFHAGALHPDTQISAIAITIDYSRTDFESMAFPCGACRQSMLEYEIKQGKPIRVFIVGKEGDVLVSKSVEQLLPLSFTGDFLQK